MSLNSLGGTNGYYYPGMFNSGAHARNRHVGGFSNDEANAGKTGATSQNGAANATNASNLTQNAPQATGAAQSVGQSGNQDSQSGNAGNASSTSNSALSPDFQSEENVLSTLMDKSLEAMNLVPSSEIAGTQISFNSLSYDVSSSVSAAVGVQGNQASAALDESQSATLEGEGQIVTPDGTTYAFKVALQVGEDQQADASTPLQGDNALSGLPSLNGGSSQAAQGGAATPVDATNGSSSDASTTSLSNYLAQLLSEMQQSASQSLASDPNSFLQSPTAATSASPSSAQAASAISSGSASTQPTINWDAIQKQTSSLIDMLDAMISENQSASGSSAASSANATAAGATQAGSSNSNSTTAAATI